MSHRQTVRQTDIAKPAQLVMLITHIYVSGVINFEANHPNGVTNLVFYKVIDQKLKVSKKTTTVAFKVTS